MIIFEASKEPSATYNLRVDPIHGIGYVPSHSLKVRGNSKE